MDIGKYLKDLRKEKKLTLVELSSKSGVSNPYLSQIENGKFVPSPEILKRLAGPLGVLHSDLMLKAGHLTQKEHKDREWDEVLYGSDSEEIVKQLRDIKIALESYYGNYYYNGHLLSIPDKKRILEVLKALFPEYSEEV